MLSALFLWGIVWACTMCFACQVVLVPDLGSEPLGSLTFKGEVSLSEIESIRSHSVDSLDPHQQGDLLACSTSVNSPRRVVEDWRSWKTRRAEEPMGWER